MKSGAANANLAYAWPTRRIHWWNWNQQDPSSRFCLKAEAHHVPARKQITRATSSFNFTFSSAKPRMLNLNQGHMSSRHVITNRKVHGGQLLRVFSFYPKRRWGSPMRFRRELEAERGIRCKGVNGGAVEIHPSTCHKNAAASAKKSAVAPWKPHTSTLCSNYAYQPHCPMKQLITKKKNPNKTKQTKNKVRTQTATGLSGVPSLLGWDSVHWGTGSQGHLVLSNGCQSHWRMANRLKGQKGKS